MSRFRRKPLFVMIACGAGALVAASPGWAQEPQRIEKIEVTGSNIKRVDAEGAAPVQIITREQMEKSGATTVAEALRNIPANSSASFDETFTGSFARGSAGVSLRGLGQKSTLVLINGRRMAIYGFAQNLQDTFVDLNSIPFGAIDRIEVLKDGASAVYGSDAIAGVVNVILRRDYRGAEGSLTVGQTSHGDGEEFKVGLAGGFGDISKDKFNALFTLDYFKREHIWAYDRDLTKTSDYTRFPGGANLTLSTLSNPGTYVRRPNTNPFPTARVPFANCPADRVQVIAGSPNCVIDTNQFQTAIPETERTGVFGRFAYEFNPNLSAFAELGFNRAETFTQSPPFSAPGNQIGPGVARVVRIILPVGHPDNPYSAPVEVRYRFTDVGPRKIENTTEATRLVAGIKGLSGSVDWEVGAGYAKSDNVQADFNNISIPGLESVIADRSFRFTNNALNTQSVYDRIRANYKRNGESETKFIDGKLRMDLMQMASGPLSVALGAEYRTEELNDVSDDILARGNVLGRGSTRAVGDRDITSAFVEFSIPVTKTLEMQLAGRHDRYSDFGNASTPKVGIRWQPTQQILARASYGKGFRAPSLPEISDSSAFFFQTLEDTRRCAINAVYCGPAGTPGSFSNNPDLKPEKSDSYTIGFVVEPLKDFSVAVDYYNIEQRNLVSSRNFQEVLNEEARTGSSAFIVRGDPTAEDIARGAPGPIVVVKAPYENLSKVKTSGIDLDLRWRIPAAALGTFTVSSNNSYLRTFKQPNTPDGPLEEFAGTYDVPRYRGTLSFGLERGPWNGVFSMNYVSAVKQSTSAGAGAEPYIGGFRTLDAQLAYTGLKNLKLVLGAKNLADQEPPVSITEGLLYSIQQHSIRGRFIYASTNYKFK